MALAAEAAAGNLPGCGTGDNFCAPGCAGSVSVGFKASASNCEQYCNTLTEAECCADVGCPKPGSALGGLGCGVCLALKKAACGIACGPC